MDLIDGIEWEYKMSNAFIPELNANRVTIKGDIVVNGHDCKILEREYIDCNLRPKQDYIYQEDNRMYFYHFEDSLFQLLYDFNFKIGDIVKVRDMGHICQVSGSFLLSNRFNKLCSNWHKSQKEIYYELWGT